MIRRFLAQRRLARMVENNRNSFETQDFIRRRKAALKGKRECNLPPCAVLGGVE